MNTFAQDQRTRRLTLAEDIIDETTLDNDDEDEADETDINIDCDVVRDLLEKLSGKYTNLTRVNPTCADVETLLLYTEMNSWKEFQQKHKPLLMEYFEADGSQAKNQFPDMKSDIVLRKQALYDRLCKKLEELRAQQEAWKLEYAENKKTFLAAKVEHLATKKSAKISKEYKERNAQANAIMDRCTERFAELSEENVREEIMDTEKKALHAFAELQFCIKAQEGNYCVWFNRGSAKRDARAFDSFMEDLAYEYSYKLEDEAKTLEAMGKERYTPAVAENLSSDFQADLQSPNEKKLQRIRDEMSQILEEAACATYGFNLAEQAWEPEWENDSLLVRRKDGRPNRWLTLEERISIKRNKAMAAATIPDDELFYAPR